MTLFQSHHLADEMGIRLILQLNKQSFPLKGKPVASSDERQHVADTGPYDPAETDHAAAL